MTEADLIETNTCDSKIQKQKIIDQYVYIHHFFSMENDHRSMTKHDYIVLCQQVIAKKIAQQALIEKDNVHFEHCDAVAYSWVYEAIFQLYAEKDIRPLYGTITPKDNLLIVETQEDFVKHVDELQLQVGEREESAKNFKELLKAVRPGQNLSKKTVHKHPMQIARQWQCDTCHGKKKVVCDACDGSGDHRCTTCNGSGEVACGTCNGRGKVACAYCGGYGQKDCTCNSGKVTCKYCYGSGRTVVLGEYQTCSACGGSGTQHCTTIGCSFGKIPCYSCSCTGYVQCQSCNNTGRLPCRSCKGSGLESCIHCDGRGEVPCDICNATGFLHTIGSAFTSCSGKCILHIKQPMTFNHQIYIDSYKYIGIVSEYENHSVLFTNVIPKSSLTIIHPTNEGKTILTMHGYNIEDASKKNYEKLIEMYTSKHVEFFLHFVGGISCISHDFINEMTEKINFILSIPYIEQSLTATSPSEEIQQVHAGLITCLTKMNRKYTLQNSIFLFISSILFFFAYLYIPFDTYFQKWDIPYAHFQNIPYALIIMFLCIIGVCAVIHRLTQRRQKQLLKKIHKQLLFWAWKHGGLYNRFHMGFLFCIGILSFLALCSFE